MLELTIIVLVLIIAILSYDSYRNRKQNQELNFTIDCLVAEKIIEIDDLKKERTKLKKKLWYLRNRNNDLEFELVAATWNKKHNRGRKFED